MKTVSVIILLILIQSCTKNNNPVLFENEANYKIVFISDRDSDGWNRPFPDTSPLPPAVGEGRL